MLDTLLKHAKHFTKLDHEEAKFINFYGDGSLFMCEGVIGLYAQGVHTEPAQFRNTSNRKVREEGITQQRALQLIKEPEEVERAAVVACNVDVQELLAYVKAVNAARMNSEEITPLRFETCERGFTCEYDDEQFQASYQDIEETYSELHHFLLSPLLLEILMKLLATLGYDDVKLYYTSLMKPVELRTYDGKLRLIILQMWG